MDTRTLIDGIVRQTTVLIAQLSTAAGIRAPLAHVADQVFLDLARELERQGVRQKVAADMFGVALRTYQKKVQRLAGCVAEHNRTLWEAVVEHIADQDRISRDELWQRFRREDSKDLGSVLQDLVDSGLVYSTGSGSATLYRMTSALDRKALQRQESRASMQDFVWLAVFRHGPIGERELGELLSYPAQGLNQALEALLREGRIERCETDGQAYRAGTFTVPVGSREGWEAAVFDHFQAVATAIAAKATSGRARSVARDTVGGATLSFDVSADHPFRDEVLGQLERVRTELNQLWERVEAHNARVPVPDVEREQVTFYFGQHAPSKASEEDRG